MQHLRETTETRHKKEPSLESPPIIRKRQGWWAGRREGLARAVLCLGAGGRLNGGCGPCCSVRFEAGSGQELGHLEMGEKLVL